MIMQGSYARQTLAPGYEWGRSDELNAAMRRAFLIPRFTSRLERVLRLIRE